MSPSNKFTVEPSKIQSSTTKVADGNAEKTISTKSTRALAIWVNLTATDGTVDFLVQTSIDGTNFFTEKSVTGVSTTGMTKIVLNRADNALGTSARLRFELGTATSITFDADAVRME